MTSLLKKRALTTIAAAVSGLVITTAIGATPAQAETAAGSCVTKGAVGGVLVENPLGAVDRLNGIELYVYDNLRDNAHVRVRLVTKNVDGVNKYWKWRKVTTGFNTQDRWITSAKESTGIFHVGVQVARYNGSKYVNHCSDWAY